MSLQKRELAELLIFLYVSFHPPPPPLSHSLPPCPTARPHSSSPALWLLSPDQQGRQGVEKWSGLVHIDPEVPKVRNFLTTCHPRGCLWGREAFHFSPLSHVRRGHQLPCCLSFSSRVLGASEHRGLQCVKPERGRSHLCPPRVLIRLKGTPPLPPIRISTFHSALLLFCTAPAASPASFSASFLSPPDSGLGSPMPGLAPRASGICAAPLSRCGEAVQEMRPPLAPGRGSRCSTFSSSFAAVARHTRLGAGVGLGNSPRPC